MFILKKREKPIDWNGVLGVIFLLVVALALSYPLICKWFGSTEMGSFFEKYDYTEEYEALIWIDKRPMFCVAEIEKNRREGYFIRKITLPYGKCKYLDDDFSPKEEKNYLYDSEIGRVEIELLRVATAGSYRKIDTEYSPSSGDFCASKKSDVFHVDEFSTFTCWNRARIKKSNEIYFRSAREARFLGFEFCSVCNERY